MDETNEQSRSNAIIEQPCLRSIEPGQSLDSADPPRYSFSIVSRGELKLSRYEVQRYQDLNKSTAQVSDRSQQVGHVPHQARWGTADRARSFKLGLACQEPPLSAATSNSRRASRYCNCQAPPKWPKIDEVEAKLVEAW